MAKLKFFDCNCSVGRVAYPFLLDISDAAGLRCEMDTAGIEEALVFHTMARDTDPPTGNSRLHEEIATAPGLHPVWVVLPHHTGEISKPEKLLKEMKEKGVKAVRIYPMRDFHSFSTSEWNAGELLSALEDARVPLMIDAEIMSWDSVQTILKDHPRLPVIGTNVTYRHNRFLYPLFDQFENLYVEISRFYAAGVIEDIVERFGPERILFGTNMPQCTGTTSVSMITYADVSHEAKEKIAGGTLRTLLKEALL